jgi:hypothetical protein
MINELIVHIGPAKTSTTALQMAFFDSRDFLKDQGFWYQIGESEIANYRMYKYLVGVPIDIAENLTAEELRGNPAFPKLASQGRQMISCEDFPSLQQQAKVDCILRWAEPENLRLILAYRDPARWLWSVYQQKSRSLTNSTKDWHKFLESSLENDGLLTSNVLKPWLNLKVPPRIQIFNQVSEPAVNTPMNIATALNVDLLPAAIENCRNKMYNESLGLGESMLMPLFNEEVVKEIKFRQQLWGDVPTEFVENVLLYQSSIAKVMFELGRDLENQILSAGYPLLDDSSLSELQHFSNVWWNDLEQVVDTLEITDQFGESIASVERSSAFAGFDMPIGKGMPMLDYANRVQLPSEFFSLARLYASNIGLLWRSLTEAKSVDWLMPSDLFRLD